MLSEERFRFSDALRRTSPLQILTLVFAIGSADTFQEIVRAILIRRVLISLLATISASDRAHVFCLVAQGLLALEDR